MLFPTSYGNNWLSGPTEYIARCTEAEVRCAKEVYRDTHGVLRWKSNHMAAPAEVVRIAGFHPEAVQDETPNIAGQRRRMEATR